MLTRLAIKNLTVFPRADLEFSNGLNVIIGENGCGKSHLLKIAYAAIAGSAEEGRKPTSGVPNKSSVQKVLADKIVSVLRPESLGRLARRKQGTERCELSFHFSDTRYDCSFGFSTRSKTEVQVDAPPEIWHDKAPIFFPTRELLTIFPGFVSIYESHYLEFDETYRDTCILLGNPAVRGAREEKVSELLAPLEKAMGGKVVLDSNGRFYLKIPGEGNIEMPLVAEGQRKLAMLARLISTGSLLDKGYLFWDEPETNLNPKLIKLVAKSILDLCQHGIQIFLATHSLFLLRELEVLYSTAPYAKLPRRYFALNPTAEGVLIEQGGRIEDLSTLTLLDEDLEQSQRYMEAGV